MKKVLGILVLGFLLSGCGGGYSMFSAFIDSEHGTGGTIWNHGMSSSNYNAIQDLANRSCVSKGYEVGKLGPNIKYGEFMTYRYDCTSNKQIASEKKQKTYDNVSEAKQVCADLGFKRGTSDFSNCALEMLTLQFEAKNRQSLSSGGTQQQIVIGQSSDVGDAMIALSGIISNANRSSSSSGTNCRIFQHAYHASIKCN